MAFTVKTKEKKPGVHLVFPVGSLDTNTYSQLDDAIAQVMLAKPAVIVFDLEELDHITSMGISVVLKTMKQMKQTNGKVRFINFQPQIKKVFDIINALPSLKIFTSIREMDQYLESMQQKIAP